MLIELNMILRDYTEFAAGFPSQNRRDFFAQRRIFGYPCALSCTRSSVGRVSVSEAEGRWFDPSRVRQFPTGRLNFFRRPVVFLLFQDSLRRAISACLLPKFALSYALFTFLNTLRSKRDFETRRLSPARSVRVP